MQMLNKIAHAAKFESTQPEAVPGKLCVWRVKTTFRAGLGQVCIQNEFTLTSNNKILRLHSTRR